jgi:alpha-glucoside transport system substrate-binding protein
VLRNRSRRLVAIVGVAAMLLIPLPARYAFAQHSHAGLPVTMFGQWATAEKADFLAIASYCDAHYGTAVTYQQSSGAFGPELATRVAGGNAPDVATLSTPSSILPYVTGGSLTPLTFVNTPTFRSQYVPFWRKLGTINGKLYAIYMKADMKAIMWYNPKKFKAGHYTIPKTWPQLVALSNKMVKAGKHPWAFGAGGSSSDNWTLMDFFDNTYLEVAGPKKYDGLVAHTVKWTDPSVAKTFQVMNQIVGNDAMIAGGRSRSISQGWSAGAAQLVTDPSAEFFAEGSFVQAGLATALPSAKIGVDFKSFPWPKYGSWKVTPATVGPNGVVMFHNTPGARALVKCLVDPKALAQWAKRGAFLSPNLKTPLSAYPDPITRSLAVLLNKAEVAGLARGGADDLMPGSLGASPAGCFGIEMVKWFQNPSSYRAEMSALEPCAVKAYKTGH